jgi:hypothetical protein
VFVRTLLSAVVATVGLFACLAHAAPPADRKVGRDAGSGDAVQTATPVPDSGRYLIDVQLSTVADHPGEFTGQLVRLRSVRVERILSPTLVKLRDAREHGPYRLGTLFRPDRLIAVLPAGTKVAKGDVLVLAGTLRTVRGAALTPETAGKDEDVLKHGNRPVLVATSATTIDGADLR